MTFKVHCNQHNVLGVILNEASVFEVDAKTVTPPDSCRATNPNLLTASDATSSLHPTLNVMNNFSRSLYP